MRQMVEGQTVKEVVVVHMVEQVVGVGSVEVGEQAVRDAGCLTPAAFPPLPPTSAPTGCPDSPSPVSPTSTLLLPPTRSDPRPYFLLSPLCLPKSLPALFPSTLFFTFALCIQALSLLQPEAWNMAPD